MKFVKWLLALMVLGILALLLAREICFEGTPRPPEPLPEGPILDMHCHVAGIGEGGSGCFVSRELRESYKYSFYMKALGVTEEEVEEKGDRLVFERLSRHLLDSRHVRAAVILALDGVVTRGELDREKTQVYVPNEYVRDETRKYPNLFYGASINPHRTDAIARLEQARKDGAVLVKWIPSVMDIDPTDERVRPFYRKLIELRMPLLTHAGQERTFGSATDELCDPLRLKVPLELGVTVIAAHISTTGTNEGQDNFERILPLFRKYQNLYTDISSLMQINKLGFLARALAMPELHHRLIYGSDWPLQFFPLVSPYYQALHLKWCQMREIAQVTSQFDRDALLKAALGVPREVFTRATEILPIDPRWCERLH